MAHLTVTGSADDCCLACATTAECSGFVVFSTTCYLKSGALSTVTLTNRAAYRLRAASPPPQIVRPPSPPSGTIVPAHVCSAPTGPDLALGSIATSSSGTASAAVDGNGGTRWESAFADPQWLVLDLGKSFVLCTASILWEGAFASMYKLQTSQDAVYWTTAVATGAQAAGWQSTSLPIGTAGRYFRMYGTERGTPYGYSIFTLSLFTAPAPPPSLPPPAPPSLPPLPPTMPAPPGPPPQPPMAPAMPCRVPAGQVVTYTGNAVGCTLGIVIEGVAYVANNTLLRAATIRVAPTGMLIIGTPGAPAVNVTLYLDHSLCADDDMTCLGYGTLTSAGEVQIHGLSRTPWALLVADCNECSTLQIDGCNGWQVGDRIVVSSTGHEATNFAQLVSPHGYGICAATDAVLTAASKTYDCSSSFDFCVCKRPTDDEAVRVASGSGSCSTQGLVDIGHQGCFDYFTTHRASFSAFKGSSEDNYLAEERIITAIDSGCGVTVDTPLWLLHRGTWLGGVVPTQAEVTNMNRSISITGPPIYWKDEARPILGGQGILVTQVGGGQMRVEWAHVNNCGRVGMGMYCVHYHLVGQCPSCAVIGSVIERGVNKGITIHGTHHATFSHNVIYDIRGASIYVEDGNEHNNTISDNVIMCPSRSSGVDRATATGKTYEGARCKLIGVPAHADSDFNEQAGIYVLTPSNHMLRNRISGMENAFFVNHQGNRIWGVGVATGSVCILSSPFGMFEGNVFHNNVGFGWCKCTGTRLGLGSSIVQWTLKFRTTGPQMRTSAFLRRLARTPPPASLRIGHRAFRST